MAVFKEDGDQPVAPSKKHPKEHFSGQEQGSRQLTKDQEAIISKISFAILDIAKRESNEDKKLLLVKSIMIDLYLPSLSMIESLEGQLAKLRKEKPTHQNNDAKMDGDTQRMIAALEDRVQELNKTNCYLETTLLKCQSDLQDYKTKLKDYETLVIKEKSHEGSFYFTL